MHTTVTKAAVVCDGCNYIIPSGYKLDEPERMLTDEEPHSFIRRVNEIDS